MKEIQSADECLGNLMSYKYFFVKFQILFFDQFYERNDKKRTAKLRRMLLIDDKAQFKSFLKFYAQMRNKGVDVKDFGKIQIDSHLSTYFQSPYLMLKSAPSQRQTPKNQEDEEDALSTPKKEALDQKKIM